MVNFAAFFCNQNVWTQVVAFNLSAILDHNTGNPTMEKERRTGRRERNKNKKEKKEGSDRESNEGRNKGRKEETKKRRKKEVKKGRLFKIKAKHRKPKHQVTSAQHTADLP